MAMSRLESWSSKSWSSKDKDRFKLMVRKELTNQETDENVNLDIKYKQDEYDPIRLIMQQPHMFFKVKNYLPVEFAATFWRYMPCEIREHLPETIESATINVPLIMHCASCKEDLKNNQLMYHKREHKFALDNVKFVERQTMSELYLNRDILIYTHKFALSRVNISLQHYFNRNMIVEMLHTKKYLPFISKSSDMMKKINAACYKYLLEGGNTSKLEEEDLSYVPSIFLDDYTKFVQYITCIFDIY